MRRLSAALGLGWVAASSGCSSVDSDPLRQVSQHAVLEGAPYPAYSMTFTTPPGVELNRLALAATDELMVRDGVVVGNPGDELFIASSGQRGVELGADARLNGSVASVGDVYLRERARVTGDVATEGGLLTQNQYTIDGSVVTGTALGAFDVKSINVVFLPSNESIALEPEQSAVRAPGNYTNVSVKSRATLHLSTGSYYFRSFTTEPQATIAIDTTAGPVRIFVEEHITLRGMMAVDAADLLIAFTGTNQVEIDAPFRGTIWAPEASLRLSPVNGSGHQGSFFAQNILCEARNPIHFVPFSGWDQLLPPPPGSALEDHGATPPVRARWVYPDGTPVRSFSYKPLAAQSFSLFSLGGFAGSPRAASAPVPTSTSLPALVGPVVPHQGGGGTPFFSAGPAPQIQSGGPVLFALGPIPGEPETTELLLNIRNAVATSTTSETVAFSISLRAWGAGNFFGDVLVQPVSGSSLLDPGEEQVVPITDLASLLPIRTAFTASKVDFIVGLHRLVGGAPEAEPFGYVGLMPVYYNYDEALEKVYTYSLEEASAVHAPPGYGPTPGVHERYRDGYLGGDMFEPTGTVGGGTTEAARQAIQNDFPDRPAFAFGVRQDVHDTPPSAGDSPIPPEGEGGVTEAYDSATGPTVPCAYWPVSFVDSGNEEFPELLDAPEWHGLVDHIPASFADAQLFDASGNLIVAGTLNQAGCFDAQELGRGHYYFRLVSQIESAGVRWDVTRNESESSEKKFFSITWSIYLRDPGSGFGSTSGEWTHESGVAGTASHIMNRRAQGIDFGLKTGSPEVYEVNVDNTDGGISSLNTGDVSLTIAPSTDMWSHDGRWKFVIAHEMGHISQWKQSAGYSPSYTFTDNASPGGMMDPASSAAYPDCNCAAIETGANQYHCLQSIETLKDAIQEGYGHAFAARTWNKLPSEPDAGACTFNYYKQTTADSLRLNGDEIHPVEVDCGDGPSHRDQTCQNVFVANQAWGTEIDWLRFLWTITSDSRGVTVSQLMPMLAAVKSDSTATFAEILAVAPATADTAWIQQQAERFGVH